MTAIAQAINDTELQPHQEPKGTNRWYLSTAPILRALIHLCVPMAAAMIVGAVYNVINAGFIGSQHDTSMLAAVTLGAPILGVVMGIGGMFGAGGGALIARLLGASENEPEQAGQIKHAASFSVWGAAIVGTIFGALGLAFLHPLVQLLGADASSLSETTSFVALMLVFVPVFAVAFCLEQLVRSEGAARQVMVGLIASTVANLAFDALFILVFHWGAAGAALGTGLANVLVVIYFVTWLQRKSEHISLAPRWFTLTPRILKPVLGIGLPELVQSGFLIVTSLVLNNLAMNYGSGPLAAMGVAVRIAQVPEFLVMGVTLGVLPLLAYSYGKGDGARLTAALRGAALTVASVGLVFAVPAVVFRGQLMAAFTADPSVVAVGVTILAAQLTAMVANGFTGLFTTLFQATGRATQAVTMSVTQGVVFIPVVIVGNAVFGLSGVIWALTVTELFVCALGLGLWLASRRGIKRGLVEGSVERADAMVE